LTNFAAPATHAFHRSAAKLRAATDEFHIEIAMQILKLKLFNTKFLAK
jgi:hypothetical protein